MSEYRTSGSNPAGFFKWHRACVVVLSSRHDDLVNKWTLYTFFVCVRITWELMYAIQHWSMELLRHSCIVENLFFFRQQTWGQQKAWTEVRRLLPFLTSTLLSTLYVKGKVSAVLQRERQEVDGMNKGSTGLTSWLGLLPWALLCHQLLHSHGQPHCRNTTGSQTFFQHHGRLSMWLRQAERRNACQIYRHPSCNTMITRLNWTLIHIMLITCEFCSED